MKKYLIFCFTIIFLLVGTYLIHFYTSFYLFPKENVEVFVTTNGKEILLNNETFAIKGINLSATIPNQNEQDFVIDKETYLMWFDKIAEMNVNTLRVYSIFNPEFYEALKEYNLNHENPLYLMQGIDVLDYEENSTKDYFDDALMKTLIDDCLTMVDVIHGKRIIPLNKAYSSGGFYTDVSEWTIGYFIGSSWSEDTMAYTNETHPEDTVYVGEYLKTSEDATPFERIMAEVGDKLLEYESKRYGSQRLITYANHPMTDPFDYEESIKDYFNKFVNFDVAHIETQENFKSGLVAAITAYSDYPDFYQFSDTNSYEKYLTQFNNHYSIPVMVSEFGYSTTRANKTVIDETTQGESIVNDIELMKKIGIDNFLIYEWTDEWDKNIWNTLPLTDTTRSQYWYDAETKTQGYGLVSFHNNTHNFILDGNSDENDGLSVKYDNSYLYITIKDNLNFDKDTFYLAFDITPKSGSTTDSTHNISFDRDADFVLQVNGKNNTQLFVQERYDFLLPLYGKKIDGHDYYQASHTPDKDSNIFRPVRQIVDTQKLVLNKSGYTISNEVTYLETGKLLFGTNNRESASYNSLSDFYYQDGILEIRLPWALLNFFDPTKDMIYDDYYEHYGVEGLNISDISIGYGTNNISLQSFSLKNTVLSTYDTIYKKSYDIIKEALKEGI